MLLLMLILMLMLLLLPCDQVLIVPADQGMATGFSFRHCKGFTSPPPPDRSTFPLKLLHEELQRLPQSVFLRFSMFIVDFLVTGGASMAVQLLPDTVGRQQWRRASTAQVRRLLRLSSLLLRPRLGGGVADLCFSNFRLYSGARVVSNLQTREQDKACPLYLGFSGSGPAAASPAAQMTAAAAAAYFPMPVNSRRRSSSIRKDVLVKSFPVFSITSFAPPVRKSLRNFLKYMFLISLEAGLSPIHSKLIV